ncbi:MAG: GNAT family N-acetyltransferase [Litorimonas sp.]
MTVRRLRATDADAMARIHAGSFDKPWPALDMAVHLSRDLCLGCGDPLSSFAVLRRSDVDAEVLTVATAPGERGRGQAGQVLEAAIRTLSESGLRDLFLEVAEDNAPARALYARLGFQPIGRRPGYYARPGGRMAAVTYSRGLAPVVLDDSPPDG